MLFPLSAAIKFATNSTSIRLALRRVLARVRIWAATFASRLTLCRTALSAVLMTPYAPVWCIIADAGTGGCLVLELVQDLQPGMFPKTFLLCGQAAEAKATGPLYWDSGSGRRRDSGRIVRKSRDLPCADQPLTNVTREEQFEAAGLTAIGDGPPLAGRSRNAEERRRAASISTRGKCNWWRLVLCHPTCRRSTCSCLPSPRRQNSACSFCWSPY